MGIREQIECERDQTIIDYAKEQPKQPLQARVEGWQDGLLNVITCEGQQRRYQQGGRAVWEGRILPPHENDSVFTGRPRILPDPRPVFISTSRPVFVDYLLYRYVEYPRSEVDRVNAKNSGVIGFNILSQSSKQFEFDSDQAAKTKDKLILSDLNGRTVEIPAWEAPAKNTEFSRILATIQQPINGNQPYITASIERGFIRIGFLHPRVIVYKGSILVIFLQRRSTSNGGSVLEAVITRLNSRLTITSTRTVTAEVFDGTTTTFNFVPELDLAVYSDNRNWLLSRQGIDTQPAGTARHSVLPQVDRGVPTWNENGIGFRPFSAYRLDGDFGPLTPQVGGSYDYDRTNDPVQPIFAQTTFDSYEALPDDAEAEIQRLASVVDAPDFSVNRDFEPYFTILSSWQNDIAGYTP